MSTSQPDIGLGKIITRRAILTPKRPAVSFEGQTWTYAAFSDQVCRLASSLRAGGVCRGDRVAYVGMNHPAFLQALYAASCLGAIFVPLNFRLTGPELEFIINDAGVHTLLVDDGLANTIDGQRQNLCVRRYISSESALPGYEPLSDILATADPVAASEAVNSDDVAFIMYTSGTTGLPKGAMLTHGNLFWNTVNSNHMQIMPSRVTLTCAPLFHIGGLNVTTLQGLATGNHVVIHRTFDAGNVLRDIEHYRVEVMFGAPAMFAFMAQHPRFEQTDLSSIDTFICGGAPVPVALMETYGQRDINFCQGYGLTETAPFATLLTTDLVAEKVGSAGLPPMFTEVRITDELNQPVEPENRGEVCVRGPNVMHGYWNRPEATAEAIDEQGWFHTGDVGYLDAEGFLYLCDRVKDMVISGGENVYPAEVEGVLFEHVAIREVAVIGLPDEKWGEAVTAIVVWEPGRSLSLEELREFAGARLARYKLPLKLESLEELPRNPAGKVLKYQLKEQFSQADTVS